MGTLKVILAKDIPNLGEEGEIKIVKRGYARNYLFPNKLVVECSKINLKSLEEKQEYFKAKKIEKRNQAEELKAKLENEKITISVAAGEKGRLYGTVTSANIADEIHKMNYPVDKKMIELKDHVKFSGKYKFRVHLYQDVYATMELDVVAVYEKKENEPPKGKKRGGRQNERNASNTSEEQNVEEHTEENAATEE